MQHLFISVIFFLLFKNHYIFKLNIKSSTSDVSAKCTSAFTGTLGVTLVSSMAWFILATIILDECKVISIIIKLTISIDIQENLDLFLGVSPDVRLAEHRVLHGQVGCVRGQARRVRDGSDMVVEVGGHVRVVTGCSVDPLGLDNPFGIGDGLLWGGHGDHPRIRGGRYS